MIAREELARAQVPDGEELILYAHGNDRMIALGGNELMSTRMQFSEEQLALLTIERVTAPAPQLLIGGYGMGFTVRAALAALGPKAKVTVAELVPEIIAWAHGPLSHLTEGCLADPRVTVAMGDVAAIIDDAVDGTSATYDAILLDVDNGPEALVREDNSRLYSRTGLARARDALSPGGVLAVWSAAPDHKFARRLKDARMEVEERFVHARPNRKGPKHTIWFARRR